MNWSKRHVIKETARTTGSGRDRYSDAGDTLVEVLLALIVLGLASVALLIAFSTSISASAEHRALATDDTVLATATQVTIANIQSQPSLFGCSPPAPLSSFPGYTSGITLPSPYAGKYTVLYATSNPVEYWSTSSESFVTRKSCQANEPLLITIYLQGTSVTNSFVVDYPIGSSNALTAGAAAQLVFIQQPVGGYAGSPFTTQPIVEVLTGGSPSTVTTDLSPVILTLTQGTGILAGCTGNEILGVVTFSGCTVGTGGSNFEITATDGSLIPVVSNPFSVNSSSFHLVFTTQPVAAASGVGFAKDPSVTVENSVNSTDVSWAGTITLTLSGGALSALPGKTCNFTTTTPPAAPIPPTTITLTPLNGVVTMPSGCAFSGGYYYDASRSPPQTATQYTMTATANPATLSDAAVPASSNTFAVTGYGSATQLAFVTQPTGVSSGTPTTPFSGQPTVAVEDAFGNVVTSASNTIGLTLNSGAQGVVLSNCNNPSPTSAGLYVFSGCEGDRYGTQLTLTASSSGLTPATSAQFSITSVATQLLFTTQPVAGDSGSVLAIEPVLTLEDASNRVVTSATAPIAFKPVVPASGTMSACTNLVPQSGVITVANCSFAGIVGTPYTIVATWGSLTSSPSSSFTPTGPGPATQLVFTTSPVAGVSGTAFTTQPIINVEDSAGNVVTTSTAVISLSPSGGTLAGCSGLTASAGIVTISNCTFAGVVLTPYTLTATSGPLTSLPSGSFSPTYAGVPSQIVLTGCSTTIVTGATCTATATIEDVYANIETHDNATLLTFSQVPAGGTVTGLGGVTVTAGVASETMTGAAQGPVDVVASGESLTSSPITVTVNAPTTTTVTSNVNPSVVGQPVTYTATVSVTSPDTGVPSGNIEFFDNGTPIGICGGAGGVTVNGSGQATCLTAWPSVATQSITATYLGNASAYYLTSNSTALSQVVNQASTTTVVTSNVNPSVVGQTVTYTATVSATSPGGGAPSAADTMTFKDGASTITCGSGSAAFNGTSATCKVTYATTAGSPHSITAVFGGDANFAPSTSTVFPQTVNQASPTIALTLSATTISAGGNAYGTSTLTGASSGAGGTVTYSYFTDSVCTQNPVVVGTAVTVSSGNVPNSNSVTFPAGDYFWHALYSGDTNDLGATSSCVKLSANNTFSETTAGTYTLTVAPYVTSFTFTMKAAGGGGGVSGASGGSGGLISGTITIPSSSSATTFTVVVGGGGGGTNGTGGASGPSGLSGSGCAAGGLGGGGTYAGGGGGGSTCIYLSGAPAGTIIAVGGGGGGGGDGTSKGGAGDSGPASNPGTTTAASGTAGGGTAGTGGTTATSGSPQYGILNTGGSNASGGSAGTCISGTCGSGGAGTTAGGNMSVGGGGGGGGMASGGGGADNGNSGNDKGGGGGAGSAYTGGTATISVSVTTATDGGGGAGGGTATSGTAGSVTFTGGLVSLA